MGKDWGSLRVLELSVSWVCCLSEGSGSRVYVVVWVREGSRNVFINQIDNEESSGYIPDKCMVKFSDQLFWLEVGVKGEEQERKGKNYHLSKSHLTVYKSCS